MNNFEFFGQNLSKKKLALEPEKINVGIRINIVETLCMPNWTTLSVLVQICPRMDLGFEIEKAHVETRINNFEITCVPIFRQNKQLWLFWSKFAQKWISVWKFRKLMLEEKLPSSRCHACHFSGKRDFSIQSYPKTNFGIGILKL